MTFPHYAFLDTTLFRIRIDTRSHLVSLDGIILIQYLTVCGGLCDEMEEGKCGQIASCIAKKKVAEKNIVQ